MIYWLSYASLDLAIIAAAMWAAYQSLWFIWPAILVIGTRQHALLVLAHEGAHGNVSDVWAAPIFWSFGISLRGYRAFHLRHHECTGTDQDPEIIYKRASPKQWSPPPRPYHLLGDLLALNIREVIGVIGLTLPQRKRDLTAPIVFTLAINAVLFWFGMWWIAALWYAALLTSFFAVFRLRVWIEHLGTNGTHRVHLPLWQRWIYAPHNIWIHWEHHKWPAVPFHLLPLARRKQNAVKIMTIKELWGSYRAGMVV